MGTNYYLRRSGTCETRCDNWIHLGKSSFGWAFTFRAYAEFESPLPDDQPVTDSDSWVKVLDQGEIRDEYGRTVERATLLELITRKRGDQQSRLWGNDFRDAAGNYFVKGEFS